MSLAPIALFVYNRLDHTKQTVAALANNELAAESDLIIFSDGAKDMPAQAAVTQVRDYLKTIVGFKSVRLVERDNNFGLAKSIITGVTELVNQFGKIIVLEDDLITSPYFLSYMNQGLSLYQDSSAVMSIHGYIYPFRGLRPETFFLKEIDCWGWGTWADRWALFEKDGQKLLQSLRDRKLIKEFDLDYSYHFSLMLREQILGLNNSWAIRWYASSFLNQRLGLYPRQSLVRNIGCDNSGVHTGRFAIFNVEITQTPIKVEKIEVQENLAVRKQLIKFFRSPRHLIIFQLMRLKNELLLRIKQFRKKYG